MKYDQTFDINEYVSMLQSPMDETAADDARAKIAEELTVALKEQENGVKRVRLAFRRSGVNRQWVR